MYEDDSASPKLPPIASNLSESEDDLGPPPRSSMPLDEADVQDVTMEYPLRAPVVRPDYGRDSLGPRASDVHMFAPFSDPREDGGFLRDDLSIQFDDSVHPLFVVLPLGKPSI